MQNENTSFAQANTAKEELTVFYKQSLPNILKKLFLEPVNGTYSLFSGRSGKDYVSSLILMGVTFVLYIIVPYLMLGSAGRQFVRFGDMIALGLTVLIFLLLVSVMGFGIKSISAKPNFKGELLTGGLCSIPLILLLIIALLAKIFFGGNNFMPGGPDMMSSLMGSGIVISVLALYMLLILINIVLQSLRSGGIKDALSWYLSPLIILLAFYIAFKIAGAIF